jgi:predicted esterase
MQLKVNRLFLLLYTLIFGALVACGFSSKPNETIKAVEKTDFCKLDPKNTYEVYIPVRNNTAEKLPLLVIIDAHGSGKFALEKFKQGANQYSVILIASNLIKNGFDGYEAAIQTLIDDVRQKYPTGEMVFMTGFSGGARMALGYALSHQLNGLILCGALANSDQINAVHCPVISISGMDDFNFMETAKFLFQDQLIPENLKIELTNASHNWPDSLMLSNALGFLRFSGLADDIHSPSKSQLKTYCQKQQSRIGSLKQQGDLLKAALIARNMASTKPFNSDLTFASTYDILKSNPEYISQLSRIEKCLNSEISLRQPYLDAFRTKDTLWWKNEILTLVEKIKTEQDSTTKEMYLRIKGFWGIASYSLCKQAVREKNVEMLNKVLSIYRLIEPENPDMFYFSSFPYFWDGNTNTTRSMLKKALESGFSDRSQLRKDFPESITSKLN